MGRPDLNPYRLATAQGWHNLSFCGNWDVDGILRDSNSFVSYSKRAAYGEELQWEEAPLVLDSTLMVTLSAKEFGNRILEVWADSPQSADRELNRLKSLYLIPEKPELERQYDRHFLEAFKQLIESVPV